MTEPHRPLSPHLSVYRFFPTMALSILHRVSGAWLALGLFALIYWLMGAAAGESEYVRATTLLGSGPAHVLLLAWLAAFCYHFARGLLHLTWDAGLAIERRAARVAGWLALAAALLAFLAAAYLLYCPRAGAP